MTWKSYAAVSGATVVAGWLASTPPPSNAPTGGAVVAMQASRRVDPVPSDIERQAMRLQTRLRAARTYAEPERNPFRFASRDPIAGPPRDADVAAPPAEPVEAAPAAPAVSLSGIAEDQVDGRVERTAVVSSPAGVLLVREGEVILGQYRVTRIESEAVELVGLSDGVSRRLTLGR